MTASGDETPHLPRRRIRTWSTRAGDRLFGAQSLAAYERTWRAFLAWAAAAGLDPRALSFPTALEGYTFLGEGKNAASLKQIRAALSFAYRHWDLKNPFARINPPIQKEPPDPLSALGGHSPAPRLP